MRTIKAHYKIKHRIFDLWLGEKKEMENNGAPSHSQLFPVLFTPAELEDLFPIDEWVEALDSPPPAAQQEIFPQFSEGLIPDIDLAELFPPSPVPPSEEEEWEEEGHRARLLGQEGMAPRRLVPRALDLATWTRRHEAAEIDESGESSSEPSEPSQHVEFITPILYSYTRPYQNIGVHGTLRQFRYAFHNFYIVDPDAPSARAMPGFNMDFLSQRFFRIRALEMGDLLMYEHGNPNFRLPHPFGHRVNWNQMYDSIMLAAQEVHTLSATPRYNPGYGGVMNEYRVTVRFWAREHDWAEYEWYYRTIYFAAINRGYDDFKRKIIWLIATIWFSSESILPEDSIDIEDYQSQDLETDSGIKLDTARFWIHYHPIPNPRPVQAPAGRDYIIYETEAQTNSKTKRCIQQSLEQCGVDDPTTAGLKSINDLLVYIKDHDLPISIIFNIPNIDREAEEHYSRQRPKKFLLPGRKYALNFYPLLQQYATKNYLHRDERERHILVYDVTRAHVEKIAGVEPRIRPDVYIGTYEIIRSVAGRKKPLIVRHWASLRAPTVPRKPEDLTRFIFFDFEAVTDELAEFFSRAFSCSYADFGFGELEKLDRLETNFDKEAAADFVKEHVNHVSGWDCIEYFLARVREKTVDHPDNRYILVGFNNANYDNFLLLDALQRLQQDEEFRNVSYVEYHGSNKIGNIFFFNSHCTTWDLRRHLAPGNLHSLCKNFSVRNFGKRPDLISHSTVQHIFNVSPGDFFAELHKVMPQEKLEEYNNYDVLSLAVLFYRYTHFMEEFECVKKAREIKPTLKPIYDQVSLPSYMFKLCSIFAEHNKLDLPAVTKNQYDFIRSASRAGRIDKFGKPQARYDEELKSLDACSMYPYIMFVSNAVFFPAGQILDGAMSSWHAIQLKSEFETSGQFSLLGFYTVDIDQQNLVDANKPLITCRKKETGNNYEYEDEAISQKGVPLSSIDIEQLLKYGCKVNFVVGSRMIEFSSRVRNYDLFGWMTDFMKAKNEQDALGEGHPDFNPSIRAICKSSLNSLSGKYMQKAYEEVCVQVHRDNYYSHLAQSKDMIPHTNTIVGYANDHMVIMSYQKKPECMMSIKPIFVGSFIYAHSRRFMYDNLLFPMGQEECLYHDTDSLKFRTTQFNRVLPRLSTTLIPHHVELEEIEPRYKDHPLFKEGSKIFGAFEDEMKPGNNRTYVNDKKEYASFRIQCGKITWSKFSMKGVPPRGLLLDVDNPDVKAFIKQHCGKVVVTDQKAALAFDIENGERLKFEDPVNTLRVFNRLWRGQPVHFMSHCFVRDMAQTGIKVTYIVKRIDPGLMKGIKA
jgi:hypothetical protein